MNGLKKLGIEMNRKSLSELAVNEPDAFKALIEKVKAAQLPELPPSKMEAELQSLVQQAEAGQDSISTWPELADFKAGFVGPNGSLTAASKGIAKLPNEEKPVFGKKINEVKQRLEKVFESIRERIEATELADKLGPAVDPTLPCYRY